jgi:predicted nuclease of predicted toxin-antitoxin system
LRLLLDEHVSQLIARQLRDRGWDVIAVAERPDLRQQDDVALLAAATAEPRGIVTADVRDFLRLAKNEQAAGRPHAALVLIRPRRFALGLAGAGGLVRALHVLLERTPSDAVSEILWLEPEE